MGGVHMEQLAYNSSIVIFLSQVSSNHRFCYYVYNCMTIYMFRANPEFAQTYDCATQTKNSKFGGQT